MRNLLEARETCRHAKRRHRGVSWLDAFWIADTVPTNRISLKVKLSAARYTVELATTGKEALAKAKSFAPNVILLDAEIDNGGAAMLCATLKSDPDLTHVPVVVIGYERAETRLSALRAGAEDFWPRPVAPDAMRTRIRALLRTASTAEELSRRQDTAQRVDANGRGTAPSPCHASCSRGRLSRRR